MSEKHYSTGTFMKGRFQSFIRNTMWIPFFIFGFFDKDFRRAFYRLTWDKDQLDKYRLIRLKKVISHAYQYSAFYRNLYQQSGVTPDDVQTLDDVKKIPVVTKSMLRSAIADGSIFTKKRAPLGTLRTSTAGSSGDPLVLYYDFHSRKQRFINTRRALWMMGAFPNKRFALVWRKKRLSLFQKIAYFFGTFTWVPVVDVMDAKKTALGKEEINHVVQQLVDFKPQVIRGYTSALLVISRLLKKHNVSLNVEHVIISAEYLPPSWWEEMEENFSCPVHNYYGGTEASPIAASLIDNKHLTVFDDFYGIELVDKNNAAVDSGTVGRILVTDYYSRYMPLIRYEIGDTAEWGSDTNYSFRTFKNVHGRINDIFVLPGGKILFSHNWHVYFREIAAISKCKIIQRDINTIDLYLEVPQQPECWDAEFAALKETVQQSVGQDVTLRWHVVSELELDAGEKFRMVRSELDINTIIQSL